MIGPAKIIPARTFPSTSRPQKSQLHSLSVRKNGGWNPFRMKNSNGHLISQQIYTCNKTTTTLSPKSTVNCTWEISTNAAKSITVLTLAHQTLTPIPPITNPPLFPPSTTISQSPIATKETHTTQLLTTLPTLTIAFNTTTSTPILHTTTTAKMFSSIL